ncbi:hypothetical protein PGT21_033274 [Puccinia graminis f. sp. tritici]|uniref:Uncharacterized protein n=1 Tax=Puccinia graminis f. sp. tritici TaxID=56615 RepID=A0A5B0MQI9_PUCGR|nr:hypothetical protein PGT21_033274 [Puccinia graminis f. sp. tritici]
MLISAIHIQFLLVGLLTVSVTPSSIWEIGHPIEADGCETSGGPLHGLENGESHVPQQHGEYTNSVFELPRKFIYACISFLPSFFGDKKQSRSISMDPEVKLKFREQMKHYQKHREELMKFDLKLRQELNKPLDIFNKENTSDQIKILEDSRQDILALGKQRIHQLIKGDPANLRVLRFLCPNTKFSAYEPLIPEDT